MKGVTMAPLHEAAQNGHLDVVKLLVEHGADINAKSKSGMTPLKTAEKYGKKDVADYLRSQGGVERVKEPRPERPRRNSRR